MSTKLYLNNLILMVENIDLEISTYSDLPSISAQEWTQADVYIQ